MIANYNSERLRGRQLTPSSRYMEVNTNIALFHFFFLLLI